MVLVKNTDFFKNSYNIISKEFNLRLQQDAYDFCQNSGNGYVFFIKQKFNLKKIPQIKNFHTTPNQFWIFQSFEEFNDEKLILLFNTKSDGSIRFNYKQYTILDNYKNSCLFLQKKND